MTEERDSKEAIDKLLDIISKQSTLLGGGDKSDEAAELKREWFKQVYAGILKTNQSLEKTQEAIAELQSNLHTHEQVSYERIVAVKDAFNNELRDVRFKYQQDLEKSHDKIEKSIQKINDRLEKLPVEVGKVKDDLKKDLENLNQTITKTFENFKEKEYKPLSDRVTSIYIKVAVISTVCGILGSIALALLKP